MFQDAAFTAIKRDCAAGNLSLAHELGHDMGAEHDAANAGSAAFAWAHGYVRGVPASAATSPWRTIMAYSGSPSSTRLKFWSNRNVNDPVGGEPMGTVKSEDNHRVLNDSALTVANFRCSKPLVQNVWMKDTWGDTGLEPDPATAAEPHVEVGNLEIYYANASTSRTWPAAWTGSPRSSSRALRPGRPRC